MENKELKHGMSITCNIRGIKIKDAKVSINLNDSRVFICHNNPDVIGDSAKDLLGYKYSYSTAEGQETYMTIEQIDPERYYFKKKGTYLLENCPLRKDVKIGSAYCINNCKFNVGSDKDKKEWIKCSYNAQEEKPRIIKDGLVKGDIIIDDDRDEVLVLAVITPELYIMSDYDNNKYAGCIRTLTECLDNNYKLKEEVKEKLPKYTMKELKEKLGDFELID